jgi:myo-inositol 2-dehydrogenase / D-chiro-inositol 1-dehydrogenase
MLMNDRRKFLATGLGVVAPRIAFGSQANSALSVGLIGCGGRGMYVSGIFARNEFAKVTTICDIYDDKIAAAQAKYSGAKVFKKAEELCQSDVDAVLIASPIVLHPDHFEMAVKAKKHIYMEKAAGVDAKGCLKVKRLAQSADKTKRISMGFQQRYGKDYQTAYQRIKSGEFGAIKMIRAAWLGGGPAYKEGHDASEEKIRNWFFYREMSGDIIVEQDCHNFDVVHWFMGKTPVKASGHGTQAIRKKGDIMDSLSVSFQFDNGLVFSYSAHQFGGQSAFSDVSETFMCENGSVRTSRQGITIWKPKAAPEEIPTKYDITQDAVNQFVDGARKGELENAALWGAESTLMAVMAKEAIYRGKEMTWEQTLKS